MSIRNLGSRLDHLERRISVGTVDMDAEAEQYGELVWGDRSGTRMYEADRDGCAVLTFAQAGGASLVYEVVGVSVEDLR